MQLLDPDQYQIAWPLFQHLGDYHLCGWAVLHGAAPGKIWVDDAAQPQVGIVESSEGWYLAGDPGCANVYSEIKNVLPFYAYLHTDPPGWEQVLGPVWSNVAARRHEREHYVFQGRPAPEWRSHLPTGVQVLPVDRSFFDLEHLENFQNVAGWVEGWSSRDHFLKRGAGTAVVVGETIVSWSIMDCAYQDRCEIGIVTDSRYRRQGFARLAVSAVLEQCLARGYREVGWQCLHSNKGSIATALSAGFQKERDYISYSSFLPAESMDDLSPAEYADWAVHYERFLPEHTWTAFMAAQAWSLAGRTDLAVENLRRLARAGWKARPEWVRGSWGLDRLCGNVEADRLIHEIVQEEQLPH